MKKIKTVFNFDTKKLLKRCNKKKYNSKEISEAVDKIINEVKNEKDNN